MERAEKFKIDSQGNSLYWCGYHKDYAPIDTFGTKGIRKKPRSRCRKCEALVERLKRLEKNSQSDDEIVDEFLALLGYQKESPSTIYQQFLEKHQLHIR
jgi:hypothetical protein